MLNKNLLTKVFLSWVVLMWLSFCMWITTVTVQEFHIVTRAHRTRFSHTMKKNSSFWRNYFSRSL